MQLLGKCGVIICTKRGKWAQYLWTWRQSVVPNDVPRDFGPVTAFGTKVQITVTRQGRREISAPRPYVTDPFHPLLPSAHVLCENTEFRVDNDYSSYFVSFRLQVLMSSYCALFWTNKIGHYLLRSYWTSSIKLLCMSKGKGNRNKQKKRTLKLSELNIFFTGSRSWNLAGRPSKERKNPNTHEMTRFWTSDGAFKVCTFCEG